MFNKSTKETTNKKEELIDETLITESNELVIKYFIYKILEKCSKKPLLKKLIISPVNLLINELHYLRDFTSEKSLFINIKNESINKIYKIISNFSDDNIGTKKFDLFLYSWVIETEKILGIFLKIMI
jgi:hypothetical protein